MKKGLLVGALVGIVVSALVMAGFAFAQTPTPVPQFPFGRGMPGGGQRGGFGQGMMGEARADGQFGPMHEYMEKAFAEALGIPQADLEAAIDSGKTMWQVAEEKGLTLEQFQKVMLEARQNAFTQMVADGVITQAQADWMLSRMGGQAGRFGGQDGCPGMGGGTNGENGSRWNSPSAPVSPSTSSSNGAF
jgi:hypothetical protein